MSNEQTIWLYFKNKGCGPAGIAGLMGNLYAESGLEPTNLQNSYNTKLKMTDAEYTAAVDNGKYKNFVKDSAGYGIAQWTFWSRKRDLLAFCQAKNQSISSLQAQLDFLYQELTTSYSTVWKTLIATTSVLEASNAVLLNFEKPASVLTEGKAKQDTITKRAGFAQTYYDKYAKQEVNTVMSNSSLATYTNISPNKTSPRRNNIDTITIHCIVGQCTAKQGCDYFAKTSVGASANYVVGKDGSIGLCVEEKDRAWTTGGTDKNGNPIRVNGISGADNDHRAVTIEVASDTTHPYAVTDKALEALVNLVADICKRNNIKELKWQGDKTLVGQTDQQNMTVHRWFANKACPGDYLYNKHGQIAAAVNDRLNGASAITPQPEEDEDMTQEKFNEMMDNYLANLNAKPATFEQDALVWAQENGLMLGNEQGQLMPKRFLTRGEFAVVLKRYDEKK